MKRAIRLMVLALLLILCACVSAAAVTPQSCAEELAQIDVFRGSDLGFELDRAPTRTEAAVMLVRLLGAEQSALEAYEAGETAHPFADVKGWASPYLAWLYSNGMVKGVSTTQYNAELPCSARDYALFLLRALGYQDGVDFEWVDTVKFATEQGFYSSALFGGALTRGDLALMSWLALQSKCSGTEQTLLRTLTQSGAINTDAARKLEDSFRKSPLRLSDGELTLDAAAWRKSSQTLTIEVQFEAGSETLNGEALQAYVTQDSTGRMLVKTEALGALVESWAERYNVSNAPYRFDSYVKGMTQIDFIRCDYRLDTAAVVKQLTQAIIAMEDCTVSAAQSCYRWGSPFDISQTHIEVDLDNQQLTYIKNGAVVVNTNIVSGLVTTRQTPTGLYEAHNRQTNCTLVGSDFRVFVKYWVSVIGDVIGLHDASWRSSFGGDIYVTDGSHGCINVPEAAMAIIFNEVEDGTPVLIHGQNRWYTPGTDESPATKQPLRGTTAQ